MSQQQIENVTLFTDASVCHDTKAAGGAFWARDAKHNASGSYVIQDVTEAHDAEVAAACMAIFNLAQHEQLGASLRRGAAVRLILVVDCLAVKRALEGERQKLCPPVQKMVAAVQQLRGELGFLLKVNHVKAHSGTKKARNWVNDWCDKEARKRMKEGRALIRHAGESQLGVLL